MSNYDYRFGGIVRLDGQRLLINDSNMYKGEDTRDLVDKFEHELAQQKDTKLE